MLLKTANKLRANFENGNKTQNKALEETNEKLKLVLHAEKATNKGSKEEPNVSNTSSVKKLKHELDSDKLANKTRELHKDQLKQELENPKTTRTVNELEIIQDKKNNTMVASNDQHKLDPSDKQGVRTLPADNYATNKLRAEYEAGKNAANSIHRFA